MKSRTKISSFLLLFTLFSTNPPHVSSYSAGAPQGVCDTMVPNHGVDPQTSPSPYKIVLSGSKLKGQDILDITLTSEDGEKEFKGFIIQVRKPGGEKTVGTFKEENEDGTAQPMNCFGGDSSAMTHTSGKLKKSVTVHWIAPNDEDGEYQIVYSVVGTDSGLFWTRVPHAEKISVTRNLQATTSAPTTQPINEDLKRKWKEIYGGCGETKGCFGMPGKCIEEYDPESDNPQTCDIMVTWENKGGKNLFELTGRPGSGSMGYVALGMSNDGKMGEDSVVGCAFRGNGQNPVINRYHNTASRGNEKHSNVTLGINRIEQWNIEGNIYCKFTQENHKLPGIDVNFDNSYHLLLSKARVVGDSNLGKHQGAKDRGASPRSVHISENIIMGADANEWLIQLHGGLMVIAWLLCASTGMFTARYYKQTHTDVMPCGKAFWFLLHTLCMISTVFLTICAAIFIVVQKKGFDLKDWHPILGIIVVGLAILQVLIALCRPHPGTPNRPIFNWIHWGVGNAAHIIGIACIFLAWDLPLANLKKKFGDEALWLWIMLALVLFHVLMHIVMSIHTLWADKEMDANNRKRAMHPGPMKPNGLNAEAPGTGFRTFMLSLYLLVMAAGAIALFVLVFWPQPKENEDEPVS